jgi:hypothetical protein
MLMDEAAVEVAAASLGTDWRASQASEEFAREIRGACEKEATEASQAVRNHAETNRQFSLPNKQQQQAQRNGASNSFAVPKPQSNPSLHSNSNNNFGAFPSFESSSSSSSSTNPILAESIHVLLERIAACTRRLAQCSGDGQLANEAALCNQIQVYARTITTLGEAQHSLWI